MRTLILRCLTLGSLTLALACEKQPTNAPNEGDVPAADDADSAGDPPAEEPKQGGW